MGQELGLSFHRSTTPFPMNLRRLPPTPFVMEATPTPNWFAKGGGGHEKASVRPILAVAFLLLLSSHQSPSRRPLPQGLINTPRPTPADPTGRAREKNPHERALRRSS